MRYKRYQKIEKRKENIQERRTTRAIYSKMVSQIKGIIRNIRQGQKEIGEDGKEKEQGNKEQQKQ